MTPGAFNQGRIKLIHVAVEVQVGARNPCQQQWRTEFGRGAEDHVDVGVFGGANRPTVELGGGEELLRVGPAGMWGRKNDT